MSEALDKAKGAVDAARALLAGAEPGTTGLLEQRDLENFSRLMEAARTNAAIAQAEALGALASMASDWYQHSRPRWWPPREG